MAANKNEAECKTWTERLCSLKDYLALPTPVSFFSSTTHAFSFFPPFFCFTCLLCLLNYSNVISSLPSTPHAFLVFRPFTNPSTYALLTFFFSWTIPVSYLSSLPLRMHFSSSCLSLTLQSVLTYLTFLFNYLYIISPLLFFSKFIGTGEEECTGRRGREGREKNG